MRQQRGLPRFTADRSFDVAELVVVFAYLVIAREVRAPAVTVVVQSGPLALLTPKDLSDELRAHDAIYDSLLAMRVRVRCERHSRLSENALRILSRA